MKNKTTLNEELNRMRFLLKVPSGKLMTISEIEKTYILEQNAPSSGADSNQSSGRAGSPSGSPSGSASGSAPNQPTTQIVLPGPLSFEKKIGNFTINLQGGNRFIIYHDEKEFTFQGVPASIQLTDPSMGPFINVAFAPTNTTDRNPLSDFFNTIRLLITSSPFQGSSTLTMDDAPLSPGLSNSIGVLYNSLVSGPFERVLNAAPFNLPPQNQRPNNFNWNQFFQGLQTGGVLNAQNIGTLRNAVTNAQVGLKRFTDALANPRNSRFQALSGLRSPIRGYTPPQTFSGGKELGAMVSVAEAGSGVSNDSVNISIALSSNAFKNTDINDQDSLTAIEVTKELMNAFYNLIRSNRQQRQGTGNLSTNPIIIPSLAQMFQDPNVTIYTNRWGDIGDYRRALRIEGINIYIKSAFPNLVRPNLPNGINIVNTLPTFQ